jgi:hypothetical protein
VPFLQLLYIADEREGVISEEKRISTFYPKGSSQGLWGPLRVCLWSHPLHRVVVCIPICHSWRIASITITLALVGIVASFVLIKFESEFGYDSQAVFATGVWSLAYIISRVALLVPLRAPSSTGPHSSRMYS